MSDNEDYQNQDEISSSTAVDSIVISSIDSPNPINKITYVTGSFINCNNPTPTPTATPIPPTATPVPPTSTPTPTPTATPVPPTSTPTPTPTSTPTPTPTSTPVPPTATPVPPTATPVPPTATPTCTVIVDGDWTFTGSSVIDPNSTNTYTVTMNAPSSTSYPITVGFTRLGGASHTPSSLTFNSAGSQTMTVTADSTPTNDDIEAYIATSACGNTSSPIRITFAATPTSTPTPTPTATPVPPTATPVPPTATPVPPTATPVPPTPTPVSYPSFYISTAQTVENVCTASPTDVAYSNGTTNPPSFGNTVYYDAAGTSPYGAGYYNTDNGYIRLNSSGVVIDSGIC